MAASIHSRSDQPRRDYLAEELAAAEQAVDAQSPARGEAARVMEEIRGKWRSADRVLQELKADIKPKLRFDRATEEYSEVLQYYNRVREKYESAQTERRLRLLNRRWEYLKDREFERFIREVFDCLGYVTELTPTTGDQGIDVIAQKAGVRWGIQCKGYSNPLGNKPVQEAVAGRAYYQCHRCMVITTSVFTSGGRALAEVNQCVLLEGRDIPRLIRGELSF
jgi:HJR/Mrr/RecB family endonuclease